MNFMKIFYTTYLISTNNFYFWYMEIKCNKCWRVYNFDDSKIWWKAKCKCWEIIEIKIIEKKEEKVKHKKNYKNIIIWLVLILLIWWYFLINKKEFKKYWNFYYVINWEKFSNSEMSIYDLDKNLLYDNITFFNIRTRNWNYIICDNEKHYRNWKEIDRFSSGDVFDELETDCKVYNSVHELLWSNKIITWQVYTNDILDYLNTFD